MYKIFYRSEKNLQINLRLIFVHISGDNQAYTAGINGTFIGTGNPEACFSLLETLVYKVESWKCNPKPCAIGSFYQPTLPPNMTFYAVGAFIHSLTAIEALDTKGVYVPSYGLIKAFEYCRKVCISLFPNRQIR